jgi:hypothetical protein
VTSVDLQPSSLDKVNDAGALIARLRELRARCGLSFRQLEQRAAARGDVLPRSTVAELLRRQTLPRSDLLTAFVLACGDEHRLDEWLAARDRLVTAPAPAAPADTPQPTAPPGAPQPYAAEQARRPRLPHTRPWHRAAIGLGLAGVAAFTLLSTGAWTQFSGASADPVPPTGEAGHPAETSARASSPALPPDGWIRIRPLRNTDLCLTEGRDRTGRYTAPVAAQRPCGEALPPRTYLRAAPGGMHQLEWHHPSNGIGCLTLIQDGLVEPWDNCRSDAAVQQFRLEPSRTATSAFRLRLAGDRCLGIRGAETVSGAEAVAQPCTAGEHQIFLIGAE